jgi:hypothetical protein
MHLCGTYQSIPAQKSDPVKGIARAKERIKWRKKKDQQVTEKEKKGLQQNSRRGPCLPQDLAAGATGVENPALHDPARRVICGAEEL